jgi:thiamine pyrophosphate-dependent acetolactate synthase large subunit-like protein
METALPIDDDGRLLRRALVERVLAVRGTALVVSGLGAPTYDVAAAGDPGENFYFWGAMGLAASTGLGLAMARPERRVLVITGDGELMMGIGSLATIAAAAPRNLAILVLDNERFGETGGQPGLTAAGADIAALARAAGFPAALEMRDESRLEDALNLLYHRPGPSLCVAKVAPGEDPKVLPSRDGAYLARRLRSALGVTDDKPVR